MTALAPPNALGPAPALDASTPSRSARIFRVSLLALVVAAAFIALIGNGSQRALDPSETFVARVPTEMHRRGEWLVPYYDDEVRLQKPPMSYWLASAAHRLFGDSSSDIITEWEARLPSAMAGVLLALVTVGLGIAVFSDRRIGIAAGAMFATSVAFLTETHHAHPEMVYALFCGAMMLCFVKAHRALGDRAARVRWGALAWLCFTAATLTKGPHIPLLIVIGIVVAMIVRRQTRSLLRLLQPLTGLAIVLIIGGAWFWLIYRAQPHALGFWWSEMFARTGDPTRWWLNPLKFYYVINTLGVTAPWFLFMLGALLLPWQRKDEAGDRAMLLWMGAVLTLGVMSFSEFRRAQYITPVAPFIFTLLAADAVSLYDRLRARESSYPVLSALLSVHALFVAVAGVAVVCMIARDGARFAAVPGAGKLAITLAGAGFGATLVGLFAGVRRPLIAFASLPVAMTFILAGVGVSGIGWSEARATRAEFAKQVAVSIDRGRDIFTIGNARAAVVTYYADRAIPHLDSHDELRAALLSHPDCLVMIERRELERYRLRGEVVLEERSIDDNAPIVVLSDVRVEDEGV